LFASQKEGMPWPTESQEIVMESNMLGAISHTGVFVSRPCPTTNAFVTDIEKQAIVLNHNLFQQ
jgi:hypothetical protein